MLVVLGDTVGAYLLILSPLERPPKWRLKRTKRELETAWDPASISFRQHKFYVEETSQNRADSPRTIVNETAGMRLILGLLPKTIAFKGDKVLDLVKPGLYRKHRQKA